MRFSVDSVIHLFNKRGQEGEEGAKKSEKEKEEGGREKRQNFPASRGLFSKGKAVSDEEAHFSFSLFFPLLLNISMIILIKKVEAEDS